MASNITDSTPNSHLCYLCLYVGSVFFNLDWFGRDAPFCRMLCIVVSQFIYVRLIPWPFVRDESIIFRVISFLAYDGYNLGCHLLQQKDVIVLANLRDCDGYNRVGP